MPRTRAFTMIEMIFVIMILLILIAVLIPSLEKAIQLSYEARCSANLNAIGIGAAAYTVDHGKFYPYRPGVMNNGWRPDQLSDHLYDDRPSVAPYLPSLNVLMCPNNWELDLTTTKKDKAGRTGWVYGDYFLFFGWKYTFGNERGMEKMDDRFSYQGRLFNFLASHAEAVNTVTKECSTSEHNSRRFEDSEKSQDLVVVPDSGPVNSADPQPRGETVFTGKSGQQFFNGAPPGTIATFSWNFISTADRKPAYLNAYRQDGSVETYKDVAVNDPRMTLIPLTSDDHLKGWNIQLPNR